MRTRFFSLIAGTIAGAAAAAHTLQPDMIFKEPAVVPPSVAAEKDVAAAGSMNAVINAYKLWRAGNALQVCFYRGSDEVQQFFIQASREWEKYANISFDYGQPSPRKCDPQHPSHIRIDFGTTGHWSSVGTDSISSQIIGQPSLNIDLAMFGDWSLADKRLVRGVILHELGHALGLEHEHQSPNDRCVAQIKWATVYAEMKRSPNEWDKDKVDFNLRALVDTERLRVTPYDPKSIMHYAFPARWFGDPSCANPGNEELSAVDKQEVALVYPRDTGQRSLLAARLTNRVDAVASRVKLTAAQRKAVQQDVSTASDRLYPGLKDAAATVTIGRDNSGILFSAPVNATSSGACSPVVTGTQGDANITIGGAGPVTCQNSAPQQ